MITFLIFIYKNFYDKKAFKEGKYTEPTQLSTQCGVAHQNLPYECYEPQVLKRDTPELKEIAMINIMLRIFKNSTKSLKN